MAEVQRFVSHKQTRILQTGEVNQEESTYIFFVNCCSTDTEMDERVTHEINYMSLACENSGFLTMKFSYGRHCFQSWDSVDSHFFSCSLCSQTLLFLFLFFLRVHTGIPTDLVERNGLTEGKRKDACDCRNYREKKIGFKDVSTNTSHYKPACAPTVNWSLFGSDKAVEYVDPNP